MSQGNKRNVRDKLTTTQPTCGWPPFLGKEGSLGEKTTVKKISLAIVVGMFISMLASVVSPAATNKPLHVVASFYPLYIHTLNLTVGASNVVVDCLAPNFSGCPHDYALTTADRRLISKADLFIINGAKLEPYSHIMRKTGKPVVDTTAGLDLLSDNPHVWLSPRLAIRQVVKISQGLAERDPANAPLYAENMAVYTNKLGQLLEKMQQDMAPFKGLKLVAAHEGFAYLAADVGLTIVATVAPDHEIQPSAQEIAGVIDLMRAQKIDRIISEANSDNKAAETVAAATGAKIYELSLVTTGPMDRDAYLKLMAGNLEVLKKAALH